ncbi:MAG: PepSY domain-containing protein [Betaproteobacteria bacterium]|jgi:Peptidase propeptide and YPEB domain.|nr:PepSY domain-containing protein [Betaproteobacteria bacterium]
MNIRKVLEVGLLCGVATTALAYKGDQYAKEATLTIEQARAEAIKAYPGTILEEELEHKLGGSGLRFSFDIRAAHMTHEVDIDAKTGKVLRNERENNNED